MQWILVWVKRKAQTVGKILHLTKTILSAESNHTLQPCYKPQNQSFSLKTTCGDFYSFAYPGVFKLELTVAWYHKSASYFYIGSRRADKYPSQ